MVNVKKRSVARCAFCGKEFNPKRSNSKHCSERCCRASYRKRHPDVFARNSKRFKENNPEAFRRIRERYLEKKYGKLVELKCPFCGKTFMPKSRRQKFCCQDCAERDSKRNRRDKINADWKRYYRQKRFEAGFLNPKVCAFCGKKFVPKRIDSTCCSRKCSIMKSKSKLRGVSK